MICEKNWIDILSALLAPIIAIMGIMFAALNYRLSARKRKDELFDRRYAFYKEVEKSWMSTLDDGVDGEDKSWDWDDVEGWAHEAEFLFGRDIVRHLRSYEGSTYNGLPWVPDSNFSKPFRKYLNF
jgi:hypothetical protein